MKDLMNDPESRRGKSKSQLKRESSGLQALGERLLELDQGSLSRLGLPEDLLQAVFEARTMKSFEARRRQLQYIGRLMREVDETELEAHLAGLDQARRRDTVRHDRIEAWRDRLASGDEAAIDEIVAHNPAADRQKLRTLARTSAQERAKNTPPHAQRKLFRYLRELDSAATAPGPDEPSAAGLDD